MQAEEMLAHVGNGGLLSEEEVLSCAESVISNTVGSAIVTRIEAYSETIAGDTCHFYKVWGIPDAR